MLNGGYQLIDISKYFTPFTYNTTTNEKDYDREMSIDNPLYKSLYDAITTEKVIILGNISLITLPTGEKQTISYTTTSRLVSESAILITALHRSTNFIDGVFVELGLDIYGNIWCSFLDNWNDI